MVQDDSTPTRKRGLGMGLSALLGDDRPTHLDTLDSMQHRDARMLPVALLSASPLQPRKIFDEVELEALAASIRERGVLQPLLVRPSVRNGPGFEIVAGERRWRAAQRAGLHEVPVTVQRLSDRETIEIALIENLQRADLRPLEEASGYMHLAHELGHSQAEIAAAVGKSRSHVANMMRLFTLPETVQTHLDSGALSAGHARALIGTPDPHELAELIVAKALSVREAEELARRAHTTQTARPARTTRQRDPNILDLEGRLSRQLGMGITIKPGKHGGRIEIQYSSLDQLDALMTLLSRQRL